MHTEKQIKNTALVPVMPMLVVKEVITMVDALFRQILLYQSTMAAVKIMLDQGLISPEEYAIIDTKLQAEFGPSLGTLLSENDWTL